MCKWLVSVCRWSLHSWELAMWWSSWLHGWWQFWRGWLSWGLWTSWNNLQSQRISVRLTKNSVWKICCISRFIWLQWTPKLYSVLLNWLIDFPWVAICHWGNGFSKKELQLKMFSCGWKVVSNFPIINLNFSDALMVCVFLTRGSVMGRAIVTWQQPMDLQRMKTQPRVGLNSMDPRVPSTRVQMVSVFYMGEFMIL